MKRLIAISALILTAACRPAAPIRVVPEPSKLIVGRLPVTPGEHWATPWQHVGAPPCGSPDHQRFTGIECYGTIPPVRGRDGNPLPGGN